MTEEEWFDFITTGTPQIVTVARLSVELCAFLHCSSNRVQMGHDYALKGMHKHQLAPHHFRALTWAIETGAAIQDHPDSLTFYWSDRIYGLFHTTIKTKLGHSELWVATFHKTTFAKFNAKLRKEKLIRGTSELTGGIFAAR